MVWVTVKDMCTYSPSFSEVLWLTWTKNFGQKSVKIQHFSCTMHHSLWLWRSRQIQRLSRASYLVVIDLAWKGLTQLPHKYHKVSSFEDILGRQWKKQGCFPYYPFEVVCFSAHDTYQDWCDWPCLPCCVRTFLVGPSSFLSSAKVPSPSRFTLWTSIMWANALLLHWGSLHLSGILFLAFCYLKHSSTRAFKYGSSEEHDRTIMKVASSPLTHPCPPSC